MKKTVNQFRIKGKYLRSYPYGNGHINDTYLVETDEERYILQRINHHIFKNVDQLMTNIEKVTQHIAKKIEMEGGDLEREVLNIIPTDVGESFLFEGGSYWRMYLFVKEAQTYEQVEDPKHFYESAYAFGKFQKYLDDFPIDELYETIPDFHHTPRRYQNFLNAIEQDRVNRLASCQDEIKFLKERASFTHLIWDAYERGDIEKRVTHNDTKLNNVMIDSQSGEAVCVIDLDTVMPGFVSDDFGDAIRFGCNTALEDEKDLRKVKFDLDLYQVYLEGFLEGLDGSLTDEEIRLLPYGAKMMTLENALRFLTDYLEGDHYFKIDYEDHNLIRARTQIKLIQEMEAVWERLEEISQTYIKMS